MNPDTIRKADKHQTDQDYERRNYGQDQAYSLEFEEHEISHDQSRFHYRKSQQNHNHQLEPQVPVGQNDLDQCQHHEPPPDPDKKLRSPDNMRIWSRHYDSSASYILFERRYTIGKMNIHPRSTKCQ